MQLKEIDNDTAIDSSTALAVRVGRQQGLTA